jgi:hypothetical protein
MMTCNIYRGLTDRINPTIKFITKYTDENNPSVYTDEITSDITIDSDVVMILCLQKEFMCWYVYIKPYISHYTMVERMVESTSSANNVYGVVDDNNNPYRNMVMNVMRMNQGVDQCPIIDEKPNADTTNFFYLLKDSDEPL